MNTLQKDELHLIRRPSCKEFVLEEWHAGREVDRSIIYVSEKNATIADVPRAKELNAVFQWEKDVN